MDGGYMLCKSGVTFVSQLCYFCTNLTAIRSLALALFLGGIDSSIVATALITIGRNFNDFARLQWVVLAYLLTYLGTAQLLFRNTTLSEHQYTTELPRFRLDILTHQRCCW